MVNIDNTHNIHTHNAHNTHKHNQECTQHTESLYTHTQLDNYVYTMWPVCSELQIIFEGNVNTIIKQIIL